MRPPHFLKANERQETPSECIFFDTETNAEIQPDGSQVLTLKFGMAVYTRKHRHGQWTAGQWYRFTDATDFWNWVVTKTRPKSKLYLFAHNLVFDMTIVHGFSILLGRKWQLVKAIVGDPPTILKYRQGNSSICLLDTFNWFHTSLAELGESMGLAKLAMPDQAAEQSAWDKYCRRDVEVLQYTMMRYFEFIKVNDLGNFQMTAASQAFAAYRHRFMGHQVLIDASEPALELARQAFYGGRTEAFFVGEKTGDFYLVDVNSMYPFVMAINDVPAKLQGFYAHISMAELPGVLNRFQVIADVDLDTTEPAFPLRTRGPLIFPVGQFRTQLATPELMYALDMGYLRKIYSAALYTHTPLFAEYVNTLFKLRQQYKAEGNLPFVSLSKLMLNSLYGKFGQRGYVFQDVGQALTDESRSWVEFQGETGQVTQHRQFGGLHQVWQTEGESFNSHPAIAAHITSYARMWLWKLICVAGREHVFYCDTDSLVVDKTGYDTLAALYLGDGLGELKLEKQFSHLVIYGCKDYQFGDVTKIKGVRKNAIQITENTYVQDSFSKFKGMVANGNLDNMVVKRQAKQLSRRYTKGFVTVSGFVQPFVLPDDLDCIMPSRYLGTPGGIGGNRHGNRAYDQAKRDDMRENLDRGKTYGELKERSQAKMGRD